MLTERHGIVAANAAATPGLGELWVTDLFAQW